MRAALGGLGGLGGCALLAFAAAFVPSARAADADADDAALQRRVDALSARVLELEARLNRIEGKTAPPAVVAPPAAVALPAAAPPAPAALTAPVAAAAPQVVPAASAPAAVALRAAQPGAPSPQALLRLNWSKIVRDLPQDEVTKLLGPPTRRLVIDGRTAWTYEYPGIGIGSVFFTDAGRVSSRQQPFGWGG